MKVKVLVRCKGVNYDLQVGDITNINKEIADKLIKFGYIQEVKFNEESSNNETATKKTNKKKTPKKTPKKSGD
ncbi:hypothetical protein AN1V17_11750 [Vallitalea sediminicola]